MKLVLMIVVLFGSMLKPVTALDLSIDRSKLTPRPSLPPILQQGDLSKRVPEFPDSSAIKDVRSPQQGDPSPRVPSVEPPPPLQQGDASKGVPEISDSRARRDPRREQQGDPSPKVPPVEGPPISGGSRPQQLLGK